MATTTTNLGLTKPSYSDVPDIAIINANMDVIDAAIVDAGETASNFITVVDQTGIMVHPENDSTTGWKISSALELLEGGVRYIKAWLNGTTPTVRLGQDASGHADVTPDGLEVFTDASTSVAQLGADGVRIGKEDEGHLEQSSDGIIMTSDSNYPIFKIGYSEAGQYSGKLAWVKYEGQSPFTFELAWEIASVSSSSFIVKGYQNNTEKVSINVSNYVSWDGRSVTIASGGCQLLSDNSCNYVRIQYIAYGEYPYFSIGENRLDRVGRFATAIGENNIARGNTSTAIGDSNEASGANSLARGLSCVASSENSFASGKECEASGYQSVALGQASKATKQGSHAQNLGTISAKFAQTAIGAYNEEDTSSTTTHSSGIANYGAYAFIIGNGTSSARSNALTVAWDGQLTIYGEYDRDGSNPASDVWGPSYVVKDVDGDNFAAFGSVKRSDGWCDAGLYAYSHNGTSQITHSFSIGIKPDGSTRVTLNKTAWLSALQLGGSSAELASDTNLYLYSNCSTPANKRTWTFGSNGRLESGVAGVGSHSWISIMKGESALYVPKDLTNSTTSNYAVGAVTMETAGGGAWTMANYNSEHLQFNYITPANRSSNTNTIATILALTPSGIALNDTTRPYLRQQLKIDGYGRLTEMTSTLTLTQSWQKIPLSSAKFLGTGCSYSANGLKISTAGTYMAWASIYMGTGYTAQDIVHFGIYVNNTQMSDWRKRVYAVGPYEVFSAGPSILQLTVNDVVDLRAYNQTGARGTINSLLGVGLVIRQIA